MNNIASNENAIRALIEQWAAAVRAKNIPAILAHHSADFVIFDVPPPLELRGLEAYEATWELFYSSQPEPIAFDIQRMEIFAGEDVAFAYAHMRCAEAGDDGKIGPLDFRLTMGLRKVAGRWVIAHEHHSVPAT